MVSYCTIKASCITISILYCAIEPSQCLLGYHFVFIVPSLSCSLPLKCPVLTLQCSIVSWCIYCIIMPCFAIIVSYYSIKVSTCFIAVLSLVITLSYSATKVHCSVISILLCYHSDMLCHLGFLLYQQRANQAFIMLYYIITLLHCAV